MSNTELGRTTASIVGRLDSAHDNAAMHLLAKGINPEVVAAAARGVRVTPRPVLPLADRGTSVLPELLARAVDYYQDVSDLIHSVVVWRAWEQMRPVYAMHPGLTDYLGEVTSDRIPTKVLTDTKLPHEHPLIVFTDPLELDNGDSGLACMLYGIAEDPEDAGYRHCSIHDPGRVEIGMQFYCETSGGQLYTITMVVDGRPDATLHVEDGSEPARSRIRGALTNLGSERASSVRDSDRRVIEQLSRTAIASVLYLCSEEPDKEHATRKIRRDVNREVGVPRSRNRNNSASAIQVGWRLGPVLPRVGDRKQRADQADQSAARSTGSETRGRTMPPHVRRAHMRLQRVGPGRSGVEVRFIGMTTVNKHLIPNSGVEVTTVMPVRPTRDAPASTMAKDGSTDAAGSVEDAGLDALDAVRSGHSPQSPVAMATSLALDEAVGQPTALAAETMQDSSAGL
ncbi:hypothetical protein ACL02S_22335 [Nocardia sp. 004]|uniref:hypothetical protein n=1 Tax=Nocardia sp. 004 TaxID=3385978 RepID=UPI0039A08F82